MIAQAWIKSRPRDEGEAFVRALASVVADEEIVHPLLPNRPKSERGAQYSGQREAADRIRTALPLLVAAIPSKLRRK